MIGLLGLLVGCLPHTALSHGDEAAATRYTVTLAAPAPAAAISLTRQHVRAFADGSDGWLVCLEASGGCVELRTFPTGEVLTVRGANRLPAADQATLAALWPVFSPRVDTDPELRSSWPLAQVGRTPLRATATGGWSRTAGRWHWAPTLSVTPGTAYTATGSAEATVRVDGGGVVEATWSLTLPLCRTDRPCEPWAFAGVLRREGSSPSRRVTPCPQAGEDPARAPLCLADGTVVADAPFQLDGESIFGAPSPAGNSATVVGEPS